MKGISYFREIIFRYSACYNIVNYMNINGEIVMPVFYNKLWKILIDKKIKCSGLKEVAGISFNVLAKMGKNEFVSMESLYKICVALDCSIDEIMEFTNHEHT